MFRRRRRDADPAAVDETAVDETAADDTDVDDTVADDRAETDADTGEDDEILSPKADRPDGPFDVDELDADEVAKTHLDFGGIRVRGVQGLKLQFQVDQRTGNATSVLIGEGDAAVQIVAVAAPRSTGLWGRTRLEIAADARRRGGSADEAKGPFGTELRVVVPVTRPDGAKAVQPSRVSGIDGPRWMLRATFLGKAITDAAAFSRLVEIVRGVVVVRGAAPMAPGDVIALKAPAGGAADTSSTAPAEGPQPGDDSTPTITA